MAMGLFWDLMQHSQLQEHAERARDLEERVAMVEKEVEQSRRLMWQMLERLEVHLKADLDGDGKVG